MALLQNVIAAGTHAARPAAGSAGVLYFETDTETLFRDNGTSWITVGWQSAVLLDYVASTDLASQLSIPTGTWADVVPNQSFTVGAGPGNVFVSVMGCILARNQVGSNSTDVPTRVVVDSAGTAIYRNI